MSAPRPISVLIGALGGEGGGVLAGWLTSAAERCGFPVQRTSIPGVAQRTGATTYYVEIVPAARAALAGEEPVLALAPVPGEIDLMISSELLEAARAVQNGIIDPERTTLIASTHRIYTVAEKAAMTDGRFDAETLHAALVRFAQRSILFDMEAAARGAGTAVSAVMLGAIAGSELLPMPREAYEEAIRAAGKGVEASLRGFAAGFAAAQRGGEAAAADAPAAARPAPAPIQGTARFADDVRALIEEGYRRQLDYQDRRYADLYLERVARVYDAEQQVRGASGFPVTAAYARFLALWMSYEDVIRVADLKSRATRFERIKREVGAKSDDIVRIVEFMKPGIEEWCAVLPAALARRVRAWAERRGRRLNVSLHIRTSTLHGLLLLRLLASLRWWRPHTLRYAEEQALIERWSDEVVAALARDAKLALEIALCGRLIKGYSDTHARGKGSFAHMLEIMTQPGMSDSERAAALRAAREGALADPEGKTLARPPGSDAAVVPIRWHQSGASARR
ncbi:MAG TPA: indolepyruvate oxidoreductase subunit beta family protein [Burkholderiales bacterium]